MSVGKTTHSAEARLQLVLEQVQAGVDRDLDTPAGVSSRPPGRAV
jgi:hypothetical protein